MRPKVYIETSVISYLTSKPSRDVVVAAKQQLTREWWSPGRGDVDVYISDLVVAEVRRGDPDAAQARVAAAGDLPVLEATEAARSIAHELVGRGAVPENAAADALHIGIATAEGMDFLVTWNFAHLANAHMRTRIAAVTNELGYRCPVICTPEELQEPDE